MDRVLWARATWAPGNRQCWRWLEGEVAETLPAQKGRCGEAWGSRFPPDLLVVLGMEPWVGIRQERPSLPPMAS